MTQPCVGIGCFGTCAACVGSELEVGQRSRQTDEFLGALLLDAGARESLGRVGAEDDDGQDDGNAFVSSNASLSEMATT